MPQFILRTENPNNIIKSVTVNASAYQAGNIILTLNSNVTSLALDHVKIQLMAAFRPCIANDDALIFEDTIRLDSILTFLRPFFTVQDRSQASQLKRETQTIIQQRQKHNGLINHAQEETLLSVCDPYLEAIIAQSKTPFIAASLLGVAFAKHCIPTQRLNRFVQDTKAKHVTNSIIDLRKIILGEGNLESTHLRLGDNLPSRKTQRFAIWRGAVKRLNSRFSELSDDDKFLMHFLLLLFVEEGFAADPLSLNKKNTVLNILANGFIDNTDDHKHKLQLASSHDVSRIVPIVVTSGMGIKPLEGEGILRLQRLQKKFSSPFIQLYIDNLQKIRNDQQHAQDDPVLKAFLSDNVDEIKQLINKNKVRFDVELPTIGERPIFYAMNNCKLEIVKILLGYDLVNVNQQSAYGVSLLQCAINHETENLPRTKLLLDHNADVFTPSGIIAHKVNEWDDEELYAVLPLTQLQHHLTESKEDANYQRLQNLFSLFINHGAGIGHDFKRDTKMIPYLKNAVLIGATGLPVSLAQTAITTLEDFKARVPITRFKHFYQIMNTLLAKPILPWSRACIQEVHKYIAQVLENIQQITSISNKAVFYYKQQEYQRALNMLTPALIKCSQIGSQGVDYHATLLYNLASANRELGRYDQAINYFSQLCDIDALRYVGVCTDKQKQLYSKHLMKLGEVYLKNDEIVVARKALQQAYKLLNKEGLEVPAELISLLDLCYGDKSNQQQVSESKEKDNKVQAALVLQRFWRAHDSNNIIITKLNRIEQQLPLCSDRQDYIELRDKVRVVVREHAAIKESQPAKYKKLLLRVTSVKRKWRQQFLDYKKEGQDIRSKLFL